MSCTFTSNSGYFSAGASTAFALPDGDWCIGCWVRIDSEPTGVQYMYSTGLGGFNSYYMYYDGAANGFAFRVVDSNGPDANLQSTTGLSLGVWRLFIFQNEESDTRLRIYMATRDGTVAVQSTLSDPSNLVRACNPTSALNIGRRDDGASNRTLSGGFMSDFFIGSFKLSTAEIGALARGLSPLMFKKRGLQVYLPMFKGDTQKDYVGGVTFTKNGTITRGEHPVAYYSGANTAAISGTSLIGGASVPPLYYNIDRKRRA